MNQKELSDELMIWLPKMSAGKTLEYAFADGGTTKIDTIEQLIRHVSGSGEIRIKVTPFPAAPDGEEWHNPDTLSVEQVGVNEDGKFEAGFRLLLKSELDVGRTKKYCQLWIGVDEEGPCGWSFGEFPGICQEETYRVHSDEHPVGSLKPASSTIKCKQRWIPKAIYQGMGMIVGSDPNNSQYMRVIEPLPWQTVWDYLYDNDDYEAFTKKMNKLKELGMIAEEEES